MHVREIQDELGFQTPAMVQGWQNEAFGAFIYNFPKTQIDDYGGEASVGRHALYVYNPTTSTEVVSKQRVRDQPMPVSLWGLALILRPSSDSCGRIFRASEPLCQEAGDAIGFHLVVPDKRIMDILDRMALDKSMGKIVIKGHANDGSCYACFNFDSLPQQLILQDIHKLDTDSAERRARGPEAPLCSSSFPWHSGRFEAYLTVVSRPYTIIHIKVIRSTIAYRASAYHTLAEPDRPATGPAAKLATA